MDADSSHRTHWITVVLSIAGVFLLGYGAVLLVIFTVRAVDPLGEEAARREADQEARIGAEQTLSWAERLLAEQPELRRPERVRELADTLGKRTLAAHADEAGNVTLDLVITGDGSSGLSSYTTRICVRLSAPAAGYATMTDVPCPPY
ncbi:hypothetical protein [Catellatospora sp. NPDC049609]|uniref:hypothetical protein n=1 Tax=Catellatospora sp. NPDC049609 TaxID=3155505 RepID=UPI0034355765